MATTKFQQNFLNVSLQNHKYPILNYEENKNCNTKRWFILAHVLQVNVSGNRLGISNCEEFIKHVDLNVTALMSMALRTIFYHMLFV